MKPLKPLLYEAVVVSKQREALKKKLYKCQITFYILTKKHWGVGHVGQLRGWESYVPAAYCVTSIYAIYLLYQVYSIK